VSEADDRNDGMVAVESLAPEERSALKRLILTLADSKRLMGIRYSDWLLGAPSIETGIAASSMAQDEWGHARLLYAMLKELDVDPLEVEHTRPAEAYASVDALDAPFPDWAAVVAGIVLVDGAITVALDAFCRGRFDPACSRIPKMLAEEEFHRSLGIAWYRRLSASGSAEATTLLRQATEAMIPPLLRWLAGDDEGASLVRAGLTDAGDAQVTAFRSAVRDVVSAVGLDVDSVELPNGPWDPARARGHGHPDDEAVERARGDRNRALFVE
jgi:ring-1,2-phenylacetyl-CoA epoxidase subunit PaaC